jgi:uncharacterized membrane protein YeaQ/YmgE (transglycosylase-associated protein family)
MTSRYRSRKFILALLALVSATGLVAAGLITPGVYQYVVLGTVGAYITGNVSQKWVEKKAEATQ